jgi:Uncharacterized protein conserved in bacteria
MKSSILANFDRADFEHVRQIALEFPGAEDGLSHHGTPAIKVRGKLLCRLHEESVFIPIRTNFDLRVKLLEAYPEYFILPEHFRKYPYICMWIDCRDSKLIREILQRGWETLASKKQLALFNSLHA